jgi:hypothetical protein
VAAASINITIDQGAAPGPYSATPSTDSQGTFDVRVADYSDAWVTFKFQASGFVPLSHQFKGSTKAPVDLCMTPGGGP